jgi:hypothetical protein
MKRMTVREFLQLMDDMAARRMDLRAYANFIKQKSREDKYLREEHLPLRAILIHKRIPHDDILELGNETEPWDARISGSLAIEVTQALPKNEHELRLHHPSRVALETYFKHADDVLQFPQVIVTSIERKHRKRYTDRRILAIVVSGAYTMEDDDVIDSWIDTVRSSTSKGAFSQVLLVETDRQKVFPIF